MSRSEILKPSMYYDNNVKYPVAGKTILPKSLIAPQFRVIFKLIGYLEIINNKNYSQASLLHVVSTSEYSEQNLCGRMRSKDARCFLR